MAPGAAPVSVVQANAQSAGLVSTRAGIEIRGTTANGLTLTDAWDLTDPNCAVPIPGQYICQPVAYNLAVTAAGNYDFTMPLNSGCCITEKAFLVVTFTGAGTCTTLPRLITTEVCDNCTSYNVYPPSGFDDLCADIGFPGSPVMYVDAACCDVVPAQRGTWGRLKTMYR